MPVRRLFGFVALGVLTLTLTAAPAPAKILDGCAALAPEELETIFEQPFTPGTVLTGDYCAFTKPSTAKVPDIVVQALVKKWKTVAKAKRAFDRDVRTTQELVGSVTELPGLGDEAFQSYFIGTDQVVVRVGKVVGRFRVDEPDSPEDVYPEQVVAVAQVAAPKLDALSKAG